MMVNTSSIFQSLDQLGDIFVTFFTSVRGEETTDMLIVVASQLFERDVFVQTFNNVDEDRKVVLEKEVFQTV